MSARTSRPSRKLKASSGASTSSPDPGPEPEFNDDIPLKASCRKAVSGSHAKSERLDAGVTRGGNPFRACERGYS